MKEESRPRLRILSMLLAALGLVVLAIGVSSTVADAGHKDGHTTGPDCDKTPQAAACEKDDMPGKSGNTVACAGPAAQHNPHCAPEETTGDDDDDDDVVTGDDDDDVVADDDAGGVVTGDDDEEEVLGVTVEAGDAPAAAPEELAFTGSSTDALALSGAGLLLLGMAAVAEGRMRRYGTTS